MMAQKNNILILEDDETRIKYFQQRFLNVSSTHQIYYARTAQQAISLLSTIDKFELIFLDHDLGNRVFVSTDDENTGSEVVRFLIKNSHKYINTYFIIHSFNTVAAKQMLDDIYENITDNVLYVPGVWTKDIFDYHIKIK